jgi:hypothetical protein
MGKRLFLASLVILIMSGLSGCGTPGYIFVSKYNSMSKSGQARVTARMKKYCPFNEGFRVGMVLVYFGGEDALIPPPDYYGPSPLRHYIYACYAMNPVYFSKPCPPHSYRPGYGDVCIYSHKLQN